MINVDWAFFESVSAPSSGLRSARLAVAGYSVPVIAAGERFALSCFFTPPAHMLRPGDARLVCRPFSLRVCPGGHRPASPSLRLVAAPTRPVPPAVHPRRPHSFVAGAGLRPSGLLRLPAFCSRLRLRFRPGSCLCYPVTV